MRRTVRLPPYCRGLPIVSIGLARVLVSGCQHPRRRAQRAQERQRPSRGRGLRCDHHYHHTAWSLPLTSTPSPRRVRSLRCRGRAPSIRPGDLTAARQAHGRSSPSTIAPDQCPRGLATQARCRSSTSLIEPLGRSCGSARADGASVASQCGVRGRRSRRAGRRQDRRHRPGGRRVVPRAHRRAWPADDTRRGGSSAARGRQLGSAESGQRSSDAITRAR